MTAVPALTGLLPESLGGLAQTQLIAELKLAHVGWHWAETEIVLPDSST